MIGCECRSQMTDEWQQFRYKYLRLSEQYNKIVLHGEGSVPSIVEENKITQYSCVYPFPGVIKAWRKTIQVGKIQNYEIAICNLIVRTFLDRRKW